jgi:hypothetical protein
VAPELERAEDAITEARREAGKLKRAIDAILDRSFAAFSKWVGWLDITASSICMLSVLFEMARW